MTSENASNATPKKERVKTRVARTRFIATLRDTANVRAAAQAAGVDRRTAYRWRDASAAFAQQWDEAIEDAVDTLEAAALRRARDGVTEPVFWQGDKIAEVKKYSDVLLMFLMKAHRPEKYREVKQLMHSSPTGGPVEMTVEDMEAVRKKRWAETEANLKAAQTLTQTDA